MTQVLNGGNVYMWEAMVSGMKKVEGKGENEYDQSTSYTCMK
jgi:hypothetical protein